MANNLATDATEARDTHDACGGSAWKQPCCEELAEPGTVMMCGPRRYWGYFEFFCSMVHKKICGVVNTAVTNITKTDGPIDPLIKRGREKDVEGILASLKSGLYDNKWFFFSTRYQIRLKLNGEVAEKLNDYSRLKLKIANYAWEMHMHKFGYGSTLAFQKRFYASTELTPCRGTEEPPRAMTLHAASA
eukprot:scaffold19935_cov108-Isochrysis_galbana.AAC.8